MDVECVEWTLSKPWVPLRVINPLFIYIYNILYKTLKTLSRGNTGGEFFGVWEKDRDALKVSTSGKNRPSAQ